MGSEAFNLAIFREPWRYPIFSDCHARNFENSCSLRQCPIPFSMECCAHFRASPRQVIGPLSIGSNKEGDKVIPTRAVANGFGSSVMFEGRERDARCNFQLDDATIAVDNIFKKALWNEVCLNHPSIEVDNAGSEQDTHAITAAFTSNLCKYSRFQSGDWLRLAERPVPPVLRFPNKIPDGLLQNEAFQDVDFIEQEGILVPRDVFGQLLVRCFAEKNEELGRRVHYLIVRSGLELDNFLGSQLVRMYGVFNNPVATNQVFSKLHSPNAFVWSAIILVHTNFGQNEQAIDLYHQMYKSTVRPDGHVFVAVLQACATLQAIRPGRNIHAHIIESRLDSDVYVGCSLINLYTKCQSLQEALSVLNRLPQRNMVTWNALITGYAHQGLDQEALQLFYQMQNEGAQPDKVTFVCVLKACSSGGALEQGKQIHAYSIESGYDLNLTVSSTLIDMYAKCGNLLDACTLFDRLPGQNVVTWSALVAGYVHHEKDWEALKLFQQMKKEGMVEPNKVTCICILKACSNIAVLEQGKKIHAFISESGHETDLSVGSALVDMYAKCGSLDDAQLVFGRLPKQNLVTWNSLIGGYALHGHGQEALNLFNHMLEQGLQPDEVTFALLLKACASILSLEQGKQIHCYSIKSGLDLDMFVGNSLIDMYVKCGSFQDAQIVFDRLPKQNVVTWSTMIAGCVQKGHAQQAAKLFQQMQLDTIKPNKITFVYILKAYSGMAAFEQGKLIHAHIIESGLGSDVYIGSALIDMYAKCGSLQDAQMVFNRLPEQDVVTWSAMIAGHAQNNDYAMACKNFGAMQQAGWKPNNVTFLCLLSACSHSGDLDKGCHHFKSMIEDYGISPAIEHYDSLADLFGHAGCLEEAEDLLETIPFQCNGVGWKSLLSSCKTQGKLLLGQRCFDHVMTMEPGNVPGYVLMSNLYSHCGMWAEAEKLDELRSFQNMWKKPAKAFIEVEKQVHTFTVGDETHPLSADIYMRLKVLSDQMQTEGYIPRYDLVLDAVSDEGKQEVLCGHCEKLAMAFGLISTPQGTTVRVAKNFRVCGDCHTAAKIVSKLEKREIIITDPYCVHRFKSGKCSCKDL